MKLSFLLGKTAADTVVMLQTAYKDAAMSKTQVYEWFARFRNGQMLLEDQARCRCPGAPANEF